MTADADLPAGWAWSTVGEITEVLDHRRVPLNRKERGRRPGAVPYYGATGLVDHVDEALFDEPLVLLGEDGAPFLDPNKPKAYCISGPSWVNNHAHVLRPKINGSFLKYYLDWFDYRGHANGTTRLKLTKSAMTAIPVAVPPLSEQERIVQALEEHRTGIDVARSAIGRALQLCDSLPAAARATAIQRVDVDAAGDEPTNRDVLAEARALRGARGRLAKPEAAPTLVPLEWPVMSLSELSWDIDYGTSTRCSYDGAGAPVLRIPNIAGGRVTTDDMKMSVDTSVDLSDSMVAPGDLLIVRSNGSRDLIGRCAPVPDGITAAFASYLIRCRLLTDFVEPGWVALVLASPHWRALLVERAASSAGQYNLSIDKLASLPIPLPPLRVQRALLRDVARQLELAEYGEASLLVQETRLSALWRAVLGAAFRGRLVGQDSGDEPAELLLKRIAEEAQAVPKSRPRRSGPRTTAHARASARSVEESA